VHRSDTKRPRCNVIAAMQSFAVVLRFATERISRGAVASSSASGCCKLSRFGSRCSRCDRGSERSNWLRRHVDAHRAPAAKSCDAEDVATAKAQDER
jgi:hypothetical protein